MKKFIIAIDGPAASGKGTLAKKIAEHYHLKHLDTGLTYRAVAAIILKHKSADFFENITKKHEDYICDIATNIDLFNLDDTSLGSHQIGQYASKIAVLKDLRHILVKKQREFSIISQKAVLDGRDVGTVICPNAEIKLFIIADVEKRAERRFLQLKQQGHKVTYNEILNDLILRDKRDTERQEAPLKAADDAHLLNTTELNITQSFQYAKNIIDNKWLNA